MSNTVLLTPPPPILPPQPNNITPEGHGQIVDHGTDGDGIEFITINSRSGNTFFLVIDHTRGGNNVYFLNAVTEWDLLNLAAEADLPTPPAFSEPPPTPTPVVQEPLPTPEPIPEPVNDNGGNMGMIIFMLLAGAGVFGAAYYFKILKPKQAKQAEEDLDDDDDDYDDNEDGEEFTEDDVLDDIENETSSVDMEEVHSSDKNEDER